MKFSVPYHSQKKNSQDCGPVCMQMMLEYFGIKKNLADLAKKLSYSKMGTSAYDNGLSLINQGLQVTAITAHPMLFPPDTIKRLTDKNVLLTYLDKQAKKLKLFKPGIKLIKNFIDAGGNLKLEIPQASHIQKALDKGSLVLALLYAGALGSKEGGFHFVVVSGYKKNMVYINNPLQHSKRQGWFPISEFLYGLHTSTCADIDNGTLLIVTK